VSFDLTFRPEAEAEVAVAKRWYDEQRPGLGSDFVHALDVALAAITENPFQYQIVWKQYRRVSLRRFPFGLIYHASNQGIVVLACIHGRRNPKVWQDRI
jgi:ParE toxin of type II toxin-antitoxin system, parDE